MRLSWMWMTAALTLAVTYGATPVQCAAPAAGAGASAPQAVLMSCSGPVTVVRADGATVEGSFGLPLRAGDAVQTGEGGSAEIFFEAGNWLQIGANSNIQVKAARGGEAAPSAETSAEAPPEAGTEAESFEVVQNFLRLKDSQGSSALTGLRSGDKQKDLVVISPSNTKLRSDRPTFRWEIADESTELQLTVYDESGVHWQGDVSGATTMEYPADAPALTPGVTYSWTLETTDPLAFPPLRTSAAFFEIMDADGASSLEESLEHIASSEQMSERTRHFLRASLYFNNGLLDDAIAETESALANDPDNASMRSILARLYEEAGRSREAMATYRQIETN